MFYITGGYRGYGEGEDERDQVKLEDQSRPLTKCQTTNPALDPPISA